MSIWPCDDLIADDRYRGMHDTTVSSETSVSTFMCSTYSCCFTLMVLFYVIIWLH